MKYRIDLQGLILSIDVKGKDLANIPNWKLDDQNYINFNLDPKIKKFKNKKRKL